MYFWRLRRLKQDLISSRVGEREALFYLLWLGGTTTAAAALPLGDFNVWNYVEIATLVVAFLLGTAYVFSCNGGSGGTAFLARYLALNWVFGIRFAVLVTIPTIALVLTAESFLPGGIPEDTTVWEFIATVALELGFYLRLGHHFREVASAEVAA